MSSRVARCDRDRPVEIPNRPIQIFRLARKHTHGVERIYMIGLGVQYLLIDQASGCQLTLLLQELCLCKLLRESCTEGIRHHGLSTLSARRPFRILASIRSSLPACRGCAESALKL